jgi:N-acetylglucosamine kinase-like BadF-type ATPase
MRLVIGIDGGGTNTRAALAAETGEVLGIGLAGPSNYDDVGVAIAQRNIGAAVRRAWQQAGRKRRPADAAFLGMAGVVSDDDRATIRQIAEQLRLAPPDRIGVDHDIRIALAGGLAGQPGIALIVGTGSSCYGRTADGRFWRAGGWGHLLDDFASGYYLGLQAMVAAVRAADGRGPQTRLLPLVMESLGLRDINELMRRLYYEGMSRAAIAALGPKVLDIAAQGDRVAKAILQRGIEELFLMVKTVAKQLNFLPGSFRLTYTGGIAQSPIFQRHFRAALRRCLPTCQLVPPILPPVLGAALLALELLGVAVTPQLVATMRQSAQAKGLEMP